jgi:hypothetical protein
MTCSKSYKSVFAVGAVILAMLSFAPASFAGEDEDDEGGAARPHQTASGGGGGGGSDSGSASGGVQAGFGGMSAEDGSLLLPLGLVGGSVVFLSAAGALSRRRVLEQ